MELEKVLRQRNIQLLIEDGRYDEAEELLKSSVIPNTGIIQARIDALRAQNRMTPVISPARRRLKMFGIALLVIIAFTGVVLVALHDTDLGLTLFLVVIAFVFVIPGVYRAASRDSAMERRINRRTGYKRPGFGPRR